jgi:hypothetical protein
MFYKFIANPLKLSEHQNLWNEALQKYFEQELGLAYTDSQKPPHSMNQVLGNAAWSKNSPFEKQQKQQFPAFVGIATFQKSQELHEKGVGPETYKFGGSTYRDRYDDLTKTTKTYIGTTDHFVMALARTLGYANVEVYCAERGFDKNAIRTANTKVSSDQNWQTQASSLLADNEHLKKTNQQLSKNQVFWKSIALIAAGVVLCMGGWWLLRPIPNAAGTITRRIADTTTLAKGIVGNWYSYNRTYEARGKRDGYVYNRMAWRVSADKDGFLNLQRYWKAMEFDGWTEFIGGTVPQLHFFVNVYQNGSGYQDPIGYRHFNCGIWGENRDWLHADTLSCVCTTYNFSDSHLGEPLASREILVRQPKATFESLKAGATSLRADEVPWLEKFLPATDSYLFQKPRPK